MTYQRHDNLLSEGVNGRVGNLGEQLLEVVKHQRVVLGQAGKRCVIAHRAQSLLPGSQRFIIKSKCINPLLLSVSANNRRCTHSNIGEIR